MVMLGGAMLPFWGYTWVVMPLLMGPTLYDVGCLLGRRLAEKALFLLCQHSLCPRLHPHSHPKLPQWVITVLQGKERELPITK